MMKSTEKVLIIIIIIIIKYDTIVNMYCTVYMYWGKTVIILNDSNS